MTGKMNDVTNEFISLFRGNPEAYGLVHGECVRKPVTFDLWREHLHGTGSLGIYPVARAVDAIPVCRWACTDIDLHGSRAVSPDEARVQAKNLVTALKVLGHTAWVELTKSFGYHVWLFATEWTDAQVMRNVMLLAHELADVLAVEVNPKSVDSELGNYVNLPYARKWVDTTGPMARQGLRSRYVIGADGSTLPLNFFVQAALLKRSTPSQLHETARLYVPPPPPQPVALRPFSGLTAPPEGEYAYSQDITDPELRAACEKLNGWGWTLFRDGPADGAGRAWTLFKLALECRNAELTPDETLMVLVDADWRWGKFMAGTDGHSNGLRYVEDIVRKVFG